MLVILGPGLLSRSKQILLSLLGNRSNVLLEMRVANLGLTWLGTTRPPHLFDFLEGLACGLWVADKGWWDKDANGKVEQPVGDGCNRHAISASFQRPHLSCLHPCHRGESQSVYDG